MSHRARYQRYPSQLLPAPASADARAVLPTPDINQVFSLELANDRRRLAHCSDVRQGVFCREGMFADRNLEADSVDGRSLHVVCYHRASQTACATFRLVLCDPGNPVAPFPIEEKADLAADPIMSRSDPERRLGIAEVSRFCILREFRQWPEEGSPPPPGFDRGTWELERRHRLGLSGLLWLGVADIVSRLGLDYLFALMEVRLARLASVTGVVFEQLGPEIARPGAMRAPFKTNRRCLKSLLANDNAAKVAEGFSSNLSRELPLNHLMGIYMDGCPAEALREAAPC